MSPQPTTSSPPSTLHHVLLTTHSIPPAQNPHNITERLRCPGTYISLTSAFAAAHKALYDLGYERDFFAAYEVFHHLEEDIDNDDDDDDGNDDDEQHHHPSSRADSVKAAAVAAVTAQEAQAPAKKALRATANDGSVFTVHVATTPNVKGWETAYEDGRIGRDVYLAVQTRVRAEEEEQKGEGFVRDHVVLAAAETEQEVCQVARIVGRKMERAAEEGSYEVVDVLGQEQGGEGEGTTESELGENVVVHAVGKEGENVVVSVMKVVELEAVRIGEASMRIR
jgi:hypothetical protein